MMTGKMPMLKQKMRLTTFVAVALSILMSAFMAMPAMSQEITPEQLDLARKFVALNDESGLFEREVIKAGIKAYQEIIPQNPKLAVPLNKVIADVAASFKPRKPELMDQIARFYAVAFSKEELQEMVDFYSSPTGRKLSKASATINSSVTQIVQVFRSNLNNEFFAKVRAELKKDGFDS
jgi:uncharacterized protein